MDSTSRRPLSCGTYYRRRHHPPTGANGALAGAASGTARVSSAAAKVCPQQLHLLVGGLLVTCITTGFAGAAAVVCS